MTLEELKNKKVTITLNKTFLLDEDFLEDVLESYIETQEEMGLSDEELLNDIIFNNYGTLDDLENYVEIDDYNINIHD